MKPARLHNGIRHYHWGSRTALARFLGRAPSGRPEAELWIGAHPHCPSRVERPEGLVPLDTLLAEAPGPLLGRRVEARFGPRLPFLLKVLAAAEPLSIQAHPGPAQAERGYAREDAAGVPLDAPQRNYCDRSHKPELIVALEPFVALRGFRPIPEILAEFEALAAGSLAAAVDDLARAPDAAGLEAFFAHVMGLAPDALAALTDAIVGAAEKDPEAARPRFTLQLAALYPGDVGLACALMLNLIELAPGEALFLPAGELHAYLAGTGIEIMASSDNVLRGGLTGKRVDVPELLATLRFESGPATVLHPESQAPGEAGYPTPATEFALSRIDAEGEAQRDVEGVEILLVVEGEGQLLCEGSQPIALERGGSVLVPAAAGSYRIRGRCSVFRARVP